MRKANASPSEIGAMTDIALNEYRSYILEQTAMEIKRVPFLAHPAVIDLEIDDIAQHVLIKFWRIQEKQQIVSPKAYLRQMIRNALRDALRQKEPTVPLPLNEEGELYQGRIMFVPGEQFQSPSAIVEQNDWLEQECFDILVEIVLTLPLRQKQAALWVFRDLAKEITALEEALLRAGVALETIEQPMTSSEALRLKASYSIALRKMQDELLMKNAVEMVEDAHGSKLYGVQKFKEREKRRIVRAQAEKQIAGINIIEGNNHTILTQQFELLTPYLAKLKETHRQAIQLHYGQHLSCAEIALHMGKAESTVRTYIRIGGERLIHLHTQQEGDRMFANMVQQQSFLLDEPYHTAILLYHQEHLCYEEIAKRLHIPEGTAKSYVSRGTVKLKHLWQTFFNERCEDRQQQREQRELVMCIDALQKPYQTVYKLCCIHQLSYKEIAVQLAIPLGTVKAQISRARARLGFTELEELSLKALKER